MLSPRRTCSVTGEGGTPDNVVLGDTVCEGRAQPNGQALVGRRMPRNMIQSKHCAAAQHALEFLAPHTARAINSTPPLAYDESKKRDSFVSKTNPPCLVHRRTNKHGKRPARADRKGAVRTRGARTHAKTRRTHTCLPRPPRQSCPETSSRKNSRESPRSRSSSMSQKNSTEKGWTVRASRQEEGFEWACIRIRSGN